MLHLRVGISTGLALFVSFGLPFVQRCEGNWEDQRAKREQAQVDYLRKNAVGYDWFANFANGNDGVPFLLLRCLPDLDPDTWGKPEENFARFGYFFDQNDADRPLPRGLGWAPLNDKDDNGPETYPPEKYDPASYDPKNPVMHVVSLSCGACHIGRVRINEGRSMDIVGGPNTQIDVRKWRKAFEVFVAKFGLLGPADVVGKTADRLIKVIDSKPEGYFYQGYRGMNAEAELTQRKLFSDRAAVTAILQAFARKVYVGEMAVAKQRHTSYLKLNAPPLDGGTPGQSDGSGDLIPKLLILGELAQAKPAELMQAIQMFLVKDYPALPREKATLTDILSTWEQKKHPYGQIDGSVKSLYYRNIAAILAIAGNPRKINYFNAQISGDFIDDLPAPPYPFAVDMVRAGKGKVLFQRHCAVCHTPVGMWQDQPFNASNFDPGTDMNRAQVLNAQAKELFLGSFKAGVPAKYSIRGPDDKLVFPFTLSNDEIVNDRTMPKNQGYVTNDLTGVWARAPYLHNGSVPTLRHLLAPRHKNSKRPEVFVRGAVDYDRENIGFVWDIERFAEYRKLDPTAALFDTRLDGASNRGHDRDVVIDGVLRRLDWSDREHRKDLGYLLEYLKTL